MWTVASDDISSSPVMQSPPPKATPSSATKRRIVHRENGREPVSRFVQSRRRLLFLSSAPRNFSLSRVPSRTTPNCASTELNGIVSVRRGTILGVASAVATRRCPKCGSERTRSVGLSASNYFRCDACEYLFRVSSDRADGAPSTGTTCPKCASNRTRIVGQSGDPALIHRECQACGRVWSRPLD